MTLYIDDVRQALHALERSGTPLGLKDFQLVITHHDRRDACCLRIAVADPGAQDAQVGQRVVDGIYAARPMFHDLLAQSLVHPLAVQWVALSALHTNPRTGKLLRVIDQRHG